MRWFSKKKDDQSIAAVTTMAHPSSNLVLDAPFGGGAARQMSDAVSITSPSRQDSGRRSRRRSKASESDGSAAPSVGEVSGWPQLQPNPARQFVYVFQHRDSKAVVVVRSTGDLSSAKTLHSLRMASSLWRELDQVTVEEAVAEAEARRQNASLQEQRQSPATSYHKPQQQQQQQQQQKSTAAARHTAAVQRASAATRLPAAASASSLVASSTPSERATIEQQSEELELLGVKCR
jgi:hypothetical protein